MQRQFDVVIERDEDGYYVASVPQLPGCHTQARSLDDVMDRGFQAHGLAGRYALDYPKRTALWADPHVRAIGISL